MNRKERLLAQGLCIVCGKHPSTANKKCTGCNARRKELEQARKNKRINSKLCVTCGENPPAEGKGDCAPCLTAKSKARWLKRYNHLKDAGLCTKCGKGPPESGVLLCAKCNFAQSTIGKTRSEKWKLAGLCLHCGQKPAREGRTTCEGCKGKHTESAKKRSEARHAQGLCVRCGKLPHSKLKKVCKVCSLKVASKTLFGTLNKYKLLAEWFKEQQATCPYTGIKLAIGDTASIDHIVPSSKGGGNERENLEWVHLWINRMKLDDPKDKFDTDLDAFLIQTVKHRFGVDLSSYATDLSAVSPASSSVFST